jgi:hypothetical protein
MRGNKNYQSQNIKMDELTGKVVMVHPTLNHDPVNRQGDIGTIIHAVQQQDDVYVQFQNQVLGLYSADALLMLIPGPFIIDKLRLELEGLKPADLLDILHIYLLQSSGQLTYQKEAMHLAFSNSKLFFATIVSLRDWIDMGLDHKRDIELSSGRTR